MKSRKPFIASATVLGVVLLVSCLLSSLVQAQTFTVLHNFTGGADGAGPYVGLTMDRAGNLYGTTNYGGNTAGVCSGQGCGVVFRMTNPGGGWVLTPLYKFAGGSDGVEPQAPVTIAPNGTPYGTTFAGGGASWCGAGCGTVYNVRPPAHASASVLGGWNESVAYAFNGDTDAAYPGYGGLYFAPDGNAYGTTMGGGAGNRGAVYELTPSAGGWTETVIYRFMAGNDGLVPFGGVVADSNGNLYGTTIAGGGASACANGCGTVYQLTPSGSGWTEHVIYSFTDGDDGETPIGNLIVDAAGNLYGTASEAGINGGGTVFELSPSNGGWTFTLLYGFSGNPNGSAGPWGGLTRDAAGNLYGTTGYDGVLGQGTVFELQPVDGGWNYVDLYEFQGSSDGAHPYGNVTVDSNGNLYGTASGDGAYAHGVVWKISGVNGAQSR
ncbi:MAG TPA: choice-of-anchor tandem repeat GloVer-containing protein [Candidatus Binatia bacterium]|nr:choice-of-anchor tandem repeat GloVer-containing protein [Candidatus Binatia bacterium]